ncbi:MAG TPA: IPT/TIG domain-containing protein [Vicinamibacterales bacterium]|jgi:sugar lactone lactonase YvrE
MKPASITAVTPLWAVEGGRVTIDGQGFTLDPQPPEVRFGTVPARLALASRHSLTAIVPEGLDGGRMPVRVDSAPGETAYVEIGAPIATGLHQVDNPAFDQEGNLYVTFSGSRGQDAPVSIYIVRRDGSREPFVVGVPNPTSMVVDAAGNLYVSSRFDGSVHRVARDGSTTIAATDLGVACGIAFGPDGNLYVGDRSGSVLRVTDNRSTLFATVPPSVAAFHLAFGPHGFLYVAAPTLASHDVVYRISPAGEVETFCEGFGRPQGLAFDVDGNLYIVDAVAGANALYRVRPDRPAVKECVLSGGALLGIAFDPRGGLVVSSSETIYRLDVGIRGLLPIGAASGAP